MQGRLLVVLMLVAVGLAGCLQAASVEPASTASALGARVALAEGPWASALAWNGSKLEASGGSGAPLGLWPACFVASCWGALECDATNCETTRFRVEGDGATVQVRAQSVRNYTVGPYVRVLDAAGEVVAEAKMTDWLSIATLEGAKPGEYDAQVIALYGEGRYEAAVVVLQQEEPSADAPVHDMLPNLATIRLGDLRIETPEGGIVADAIRVAGGTGCSSGEFVEAMARRCLRFSNGIANLGEGALEVRLATPDALGSFAGAGRFVQILHASDGSTREEPVGGASFHAAHGHYHYTGLATYELYAYDEAAKARGEQVGAGRKAGFCFYDTAMIDITRADVGEQQFDGSGCLDPTASASGESWYTGVSPGFTDYYGWYLPDQYVEITGLPDGTYELVSIADGNGTLVESDTSDNAATAVFRLAGDDVEVLWTTGA